MITSTYVKSKKQYKVSFELAQEGVGADRDVRVLGTFNDWSWDDGIKLKSGKKGYTGATQLPNGTYQFRYLVDGHHWVNDESAETYTDSGHGSTNCSFTLEEVTEDGKQASTKQASTKIEAAKSAPATQPVVDPEAEKQKADKQTAAKQDSDTASGTKKAAAKKPAAKKTTAKKTTAKKSTKKGDDLKKIEGIGPKIAGLLNEAGINTFAELAKATEKQLADVLQEAGARFRLAKHDTWTEQAQLAADGKTDELKKLQDSLKGGKK